MSVLQVVGSARIWKAGVPAESARAWLTGSGRLLLRLKPSQLAGMQRSVAGAATAADFIKWLDHFLAGIARRSKGRSILCRDVGGAAFHARLVEAFRDNLAAVRRPPERDSRDQPDEEHAFGQVCLKLSGAVPEQSIRDLQDQRDLAIHREFLAALIKCHQAQREWKEEMERCHQAAAF